jgi:integral membrane sensor domain MASE1
MREKWTLWGFMLCISLGTMAGVGYFVAQNDPISAVIFGLPPLMAVTGSLWATRNFFSEEPK